jgi:hypothetical protein
MKRDLDVVRKLMETFEEKLPGPPIRTFSGDFAMPSPEALEHVALMCDAGLLESNCDPLRGHVYVKRITWAGYDFLDAARNEDVWQKTKEKATAPGSWTFALILEILKVAATKCNSGLIG